MSMPAPQFGAPVALRRWPWARVSFSLESGRLPRFEHLQRYTALFSLARLVAGRLSHPQRQAPVESCLR